MKTLLILFGVFFGFAVVFSLATRKYLNPYKLFLVFGKKGSGKSTYLVRLAHEHMKKGWIVYTNLDELFMPGVRHFNIQHLGDFVPEARSLLLLDEVGMIWDNRDYKVFKPSVRDFFKLQRHYRVKVYMASQTFDVDKKLRDLCDGMFLHQNVARIFTMGKRIVRKVVITQSTSEAESRISEDLVICPFWQWTFTYIPKWAKYFDSHSVPQKEYLEFREDLSDVSNKADVGTPFPHPFSLRILRKHSNELPYIQDSGGTDIESAPSRSFLRLRRAYRVKPSQDEKE